MILVVDASVVIKWFVHEPLHLQARRLLVDRHEFIEPDLLIAEVANIAWKKTIRREISPDQARSIVRNIAFSPFVSRFVESATLRDKALALALRWNHPVYDCFYASCAEALSAPFVSADEKFLRLLKAQSSPIRAVPLAQAEALTGN